MIHLIDQIKRPALKFAYIDKIKKTNDFCRLPRLKLLEHFILIFKIRYFKAE
jgi:hypothetical protein